MNGKKYPREFEAITKDGGLRRLKVPGGWLIHGVSEYVHGVQLQTCSEALTYLPDPNYEWNLEMT